MSSRLDLWDSCASRSTEESIAFASFSSQGLGLTVQWPIELGSLARLPHAEAGCMKVAKLLQAKFKAYQEEKRKLTSSWVSDKKLSCISRWRCCFAAFVQNYKPTEVLATRLLHIATMSCVQVVDPLLWIPVSRCLKHQGWKETAERLCIMWVKQSLQLQTPSETVSGVVFFGSKHLLRGYMEP